MLLTEHLSNLAIPLRRLCEQDIRRLIEFKAGKGHALAKSKADPPPMLRQLKPHELDEIEQAYKAGSSATELAARFGIDRTTITRRLRLRGVQIRMPEPTLGTEAVKEAAALYEAGWSLSQLGEKFGLSGKAISNTLKQAGVMIRLPTGG